MSRALALFSWSAALFFSWCLQELDYVIIFEFRSTRCKIWYTTRVWLKCHIFSSVISVVLFSLLLRICLSSWSIAVCRIVCFIWQVLNLLVSLSTFIILTKGISQCHKADFSTLETWFNISGTCTSSFAAFCTGENGTIEAKMVLID